jgi:pantetheine-phosphate adenylyltransferase
MTRAVFPGTFDPVHLGHLDIIHRAAAIFDDLIVAVYNRPLKSLLFSTKERIALLEEELSELPNIRVGHYDCLTVDYARAEKAQAIVRGLRVFSDFEFEFRMALTNSRLAPDIEMVFFMTREEHTFLSSTTVKEVASLHGDISTMVSPAVSRVLQARFAEEAEKR